MGCGCKEASGNTVNLVSESIKERTILVRDTCKKCTFKHLSYAYVAMMESEYGYPDHIKLARNILMDLGISPPFTLVDMNKNLSVKAKAVGHLVHAMEECPNRNLAMKIRRAYTAILDGDTDVDILSLLADLDNSPKES